MKEYVDKLSQNVSKSIDTDKGNTSYRKWKLETNTLL